MNYSSRTFVILALALFCLLLQESAFAQTDPPEITKPGTKDTIFVIRRDTVVVIQRDSVTILNQGSDEEEQISEAEYRRRQRVGGYKVDDRNTDVIQRRIDLREQRRKEYEEWYDAQPVVRSGNTLGYKFYPSALGQIDFPSIRFGIEKTYNASLGIQGSFGFLTTPFQAWAGGNQNIGNPRYGLRGFSVGLSGRYYLSNVKNRFPFYMELETDYSLAPLTMDFWVTSADGTFEQFIAAPVNGQQFYLGFLTGWELRTKDGFLTDLATGLRIGSKSIRSSNTQIQQNINNTFWNVNRNNGSTPYLSIVMRIGLGYGHWIQPEAAKKSSSTSKKKKSSKKRKSSKRRKR